MRHPIALLLIVCTVGTFACRATPGLDDPDGRVPVICTPTQSSGTGPINDPNGPYGHQVVIGHTTDGLTITGLHQVIDHASVPDGVRRSDGTVLVYYVDGANGGVRVARIEGDSAIVLGAISLNGVNNPAGVVDPDATLLANGSVRLAYFAGFGPPTPAAPRAMCLADSDDGIHFTARSAAISFSNNEQATDPSLLALDDGHWLMAISLGQQTMIARSSDGLAFTLEATLSYGGVPELARVDAGVIRLYVCSQGITAYRSTDQGHSWTRERTVVSSPVNGHQIVCDPSLVAGAGLFVFKTGG